MYSQSSFLIVLGLLIFMLLAMEIGFRNGRRKQASVAEAITQANSVLVSMLGLLALLLAFRALAEECLRRAERDQASVFALHTSELMQVALPMYQPV